MVAVEAAGSTVGTVAVAVVGLVPEAVTILVVSAIEGTTAAGPMVTVAAAGAGGNPLAAAITPLAVRAALRAAGEVEGKGEAEAAGISILWASHSVIIKSFCTQLSFYWEFGL